jgi:hypothetical protein
MAKKINKNPMGTYVMSAYEQEAYRWCIANGVYVSPKAESNKEGNSKWHLLVDVNKEIKISPNVYGPIEIWKKQAELYRFLYEKHNNKESTIVVKEPKKKKIKKEVSNNDLTLF